MSGSTLTEPGLQERTEYSHSVRNMSNVFSSKAMLSYLLSDVSKQVTVVANISQVFIHCFMANTPLLVFKS